MASRAPAASAEATDPSSAAAARARVRASSSASRDRSDPHASGWSELARTSTARERTSSSTSCRRVTSRGCSPSPVRATPRRAARRTTGSSSLRFRSRTGVASIEDESARISVAMRRTVGRDRMPLRGRSPTPRASGPEPSERLLLHHEHLGVAGPESFQSAAAPTWPRHMAPVAAAAAVKDNQGDWWGLEHSLRQQEQGPGATMPAAAARRP